VPFEMVEFEKRIKEKWPSMEMPGAGVAVGVAQ
jgi:hypothetical protein